MRKLQYLAIGLACLAVFWAASTVGFSLLLYVEFSTWPDYMTLDEVAEEPFVQVMACLTSVAVSTLAIPAIARKVLK